MAISENIEVDAGEAIASVDDLATAFEDLADKAAASLAKIDSALDGLGGGSAAAAGPDKLVAAWDKAADSVSAAADKIAESIGKIGDIGAVSSAAGPDKLAAAWDDAAASVSASVDKIAGSGAKLDDLGAGAAGAAGPVGDLGDALKSTAAEADALGASAAPAADGLKGIGDSAKENAAALAEYQAVMREVAADQAALAAASTDASAKIAMGQRLNTAAMKDASDDAIAAQAAQADAAKSAAADAEASAGRYHMLMLGGAAALGYGVYEAAQLQTQVTRLYTTAGESQKNLPMITQGILGLSGQTNTSQSQLAQGAYWVESAGFHGQSALNILKAVAEGSQAEGAPLQDVANAATSVMNAYGMKGSQQQAMQVVNEMLTTVGEGKMTMAQLATALPAVLPLAASHAPGEQPLSFAQVGGALATMTGMGYSAQWGAQHLSHTIGALQNPNQVQTQYMQQFGLNPNEITKNLGSQGLTGTLSEIQTAVLSHMGPSGMVMLKAMNQASSYLQDANLMLPELPKSVQGLAEQYEQGKVSAKTFQQEMFQGSESGIAKAQLQQFAANVDKAHQFNPLLAAGQPAEMAYQAAISKIMGGSVGEQTFLSLMGEHLGTFKANVDAAGESVKKTGDNVQGWKAVQDTLNFQLGSSVKSLQAVATEAGQVALPTVTTALKGIADAGGFLASHPAVTQPLLEGGGILAAMAILPKVASMASTLAASAGKVGEAIGIPGAEKLSGFGQDTGASGASAANDRLAASADRAAASLDRVGASGDTAAAGEDAAGAAGGKEALGEEAGGVGGIGGKGGVAGAVGTAGIGLIISSIIDGALKNQKNSQGNWLDNAFGTPSKSGWNNWGSFGHDIGDMWGLLPGGGNAAAARNAAASQSESRFGIPTPGTGTAATQAAPPEKIAPTVDMSALATAKATAAQDAAGIGSALKSVSQQPVKIGAPDLSALAAAKGKAAQDADGIHTAVQTPLSKPVKATAPDLSAYAAAKGKAASDGAQIDAGLASGILANEGAVVAAANQVANAAEAAMAHALQTHSPSKVTEAIGEDTSAGLASGITKGTSTVKAAAVSLSASTITSLTTGLQGGTSAINAALQAITGKGSRPQDITTIINTISTLKGDVAQALSAGQISKPEDSALVKMLTADNTKLQALSARRTVLETEITDAQQIAQQAISGASITNAGTYTPVLAASSGPLAASATITGMQGMAADQAQFAKVIGQLKSQGLNATDLNQFIQAGTSSLPQALGLEQGGKSAIQQVNKLQSQIKSSAAKLGNEGAAPMYQAGVQAAQGLATGIESQLSMVDSAIKKLADSMVNEIKSALKSHSPSQVFAEIGMGIPQGTAQGVDAGTPIAQAAVARMGNSLGSRLSPYHPGLAYGHRANGGSSGPAGGTAPHVTIQMTIMGSVVSENDLIASVQKGLLKQGLSNWRTGIIPQGRAG